LEFARKKAVPIRFFFVPLQTALVFGGGHGEARLQMCFLLHVVGDGHSHVGHDLGFDEQTTFTRFFRRTAGTTPSDFRRSK